MTYKFEAKYIFRRLIYQVPAALAFIWAMRVLCSIFYGM